MVLPKHLSLISFMLAVDASIFHIVYSLAGMHCFLPSWCFSIKVMNENRVVLEFLTNNSSVNWDGILSLPTLSHFFPQDSSIQVTKTALSLWEEKKAQGFLLSTLPSWSVVWARLFPGWVSTGEVVAYCSAQGLEQAGVGQRVSSQLDSGKLH